MLLNALTSANSLLRNHPTKIKNRNQFTNYFARKVIVKDLSKSSVFA